MEITLNEIIERGKAKGIPETFLKRSTIDTASTADENLTRMESEWGELKQIAINSSIGDGKVVAGITATGENVSAAIKNFAKSNVDAAAVKPKESASDPGSGFMNLG